MKGFSLRLFILFFCAAGSVLILQSAFDAADHKKGEAAVRGYVAGGRFFGPWLETQEPGGSWGSEITNDCRGVIRVSYDTPHGSYQLYVDRSIHGITGANPLGEEMWKRFNALPPLPALPAARPPAADGGAPHR